MRLAPPVLVFAVLLAPVARSADPLGGDPGELRSGNATAVSEDQCETTADAASLAGGDFTFELRPTLKTRDLSCYLSKRERPDWLGAADLVIIDTRPESAFRRVQIPGSINLPAHSLKTQTYLKQKRVLLVNQGYSGIDLERTCSRLRSEGFVSIRILDGGLDAWRRGGGDLVGDPLAIERLDRIPPAGLAREVGLDHWLVLDLSNSDPGTLDASFAWIVHLGHPIPSDQRIRERVSEAIEARGRSGPDIFVAVVDQDGGSHSVVKRALEPLRLDHLYFLEGGLDAFRVYRSQHERMLAKAQQPLTGKACGGE